MAKDDKSNAVTHVSIDEGTEFKKISSDKPLKQIDDLEISEKKIVGMGGEEQTVYVGIMPNYFARTTDSMLADIMGREKFYGESAISRLAGEDQAKTEKEKSAEGFEGGRIIKAGRVDNVDYFTEGYRHVLGAVQGSDIRVLLTLPPEEIAEQQKLRKMGEGGTSNIRMLEEVVRPEGRVTGTKTIAQNIAGSFVLRDEIYRLGKKASIVNIGGGTCEIVGVNINPNQPFYLNPMNLVVLKDAENEKNLGCNWRDEKVRGAIEEKVGFPVGGRFIRNLMIQYSFVGEDEELEKRLRQYPITGEYGQKVEADIYEEVKSGSEAMIKAIPLGLKELAARFREEDTRKQLTGNVYILGQGAKTKNLKRELEALGVGATIPDDCVYPDTLGGLYIARLLTKNNRWKKQE